MLDPLPIGLQDVHAAAARIAGQARRTSVRTAPALDSACGASVFLKCENEQLGGAFKFRGAFNALLQLDEPARCAGVVTHSSGNHAQALALAARLLGAPATVVMPRTALTVKKEATARHGAHIVLCEPTLAAREASAADLIDRYGLALIHPYDDWRVIAGQGTAALEMWEQAGPFDLVLTPVGGGGLLAGTALAVKGLSPVTQVVGVEPEAADDARRSFRSGVIQPSNDPQTIADGLRTALGERPFAVIRRLVDDIVVVSEDEICDALRFLRDHAHLRVEPSSAVPVAALLNHRIDAVRGCRVGVVLTGGNVD